MTCSWSRKAYRARGSELRSEFDHHAGLLGHREGDAAVVLAERIRVEVRVDLLRDRDARVAEDLRELEDVAAGRQEQAGEGVPQVVDAQLLGSAGAPHGGLDRADHGRLVSR